MRKFAFIIKLKNDIAFWLHKALRSKSEKKSCCVSLSSKGYKVMTIYQIFRAYKAVGKPIYFLPLTTSENELAKAVFECLEKSCVIRHALTDSASDYLNFIKERSLKSYYASSIECIIELNSVTGLIKFSLWEQAENGRGMIPNSKQSLIVNYQKGKEQNIAQHIIEILMKELREKKNN